MRRISKRSHVIARAFAYLKELAAHTGSNPQRFHQKANPAEVCVHQRVNRKSLNGRNCRTAQIPCPNWSENSANRLIRVIRGSLVFRSRGVA